MLDRVSVAIAGAVFVRRNGQVLTCRFMNAASRTHALVNRAQCVRALDAAAHSRELARIKAVRRCVVIATRRVNAWMHRRGDSIRWRVDNGKLAVDVLEIVAPISARQFSRFRLE